MISREQPEKFKDIYRKQFGKDISDQEALEKGTRLIRLIEIIYKPMMKDDFEMV